MSFLKYNNVCVLNRLVLCSSIAVTVCTLGWLLNYSRYGIDFTDEGFYIVWMSNPFQYSVSYTQFGFIYHPLYKLLNGNIAALRQANILITFLLSWMLGSIFLKTVYCNRLIDRPTRLVVSAAIAAGGALSLVHAGFWLPTPSYNSLALQALLVTTIGLLLTDKKISYVSMLGWILIGAGGWLSFMAKPTTAAALALLSVLYLIMARKIYFRLMVVSLITAIGLFVLSALVIDGSVAIFIDRLKEGVKVFATIGLDRTLKTLLKLEDFPLTESAKYLLFIGAAAIFFVTFLSQLKTKLLCFIGALLSISFALTSLAIVFGFIRQVFNCDLFQGLLIWTVPLAAILFGLSIYRFKGLLQVSRAQWALALTFLALPYVYAFGTGNNYWVLIASAGIFCIFAGLVFLGPVETKQLSLALLTLGLAVQMITAVQIHAAIETPYRQPQPLRENNCEMNIGKPGAMLVLSQDFGRYIAEAIRFADQAEFKNGTPVIDLTGQSPTILYAIGARNIGQAWMVGGYPGSDKLAVDMLKRVSCEDLSRAWLLIEPDGPRKISFEALSSFGANLATDFEIIGTFKTAVGAGGYKETRLQQLLKPTRSVKDAMIACVASRTHN